MLNGLMQGVDLLIDADTVGHGFGPGEVEQTQGV